MTDDETAGIAWWNALTEEQRAYWLAQANTASVAEAWAYWGDLKKGKFLYAKAPESA
jgi:hypothetical protein